MHAVDVYVVEDEANIRCELCELVERFGASAHGYESGAQFLAVAAESAPGIILLDLNMPGKKGMDVLNALHAMDSPHTTIVITGSANVSIAVAAMKAGAADFLEKPFLPEQLSISLYRARESHHVALAQYNRRSVASAAVATLSARERALLRGVAQGHTNKIIARELELSVRTVEMFRSSMMEKLGAHNVAGVVRAALDSNFLF